MADEQRPDQGGGADPAAGSSTPVQGPPDEARVPWTRFEADLLDGVDPDVKVDLALPPRSYRGTDGVRELIRQVLPIDPDRYVFVRTNEQGRIVSLPLPIRAAGRDAILAGPPTGWIGAAPDGDPDRGFWQRIAPVGPVFVALTAFLTFLGVFWQRFPDWGPAVPPAELAVVIGEVALEERVRVDSGPNDLVVAYDVSFTGYRQDVIHVEWAVFDAEMQTRVRLAPSVRILDEDRGNAVASDVRADADTDRGRGRIEFAAPLQGECIFVRVYAYDTDYNRLDYGDTAPFHRRDAAQPCAAPAATAAAGS